MLQTLDFTIRIGSTPTFLYFDLHLYSAYAAQYVFSPRYDWPKFTVISIDYALIRYTHEEENKRIIIE